MVTLLEAVVIDNSTNRVVRVGVIDFFVGGHEACNDVSLASGKSTCDVAMPEGKVPAKAAYLGTPKLDPSSATTTLDGLRSIEFSCTTTTCTPYHHPPGIPPTTTLPRPRSCPTKGVCRVPSIILVRQTHSLHRLGPPARACTSIVVLHHSTTAEKAYLALLLVLLAAMGVLGWMIWTDRHKLTASEAADVLDDKIL